MQNVYTRKVFRSEEKEWIMVIESAMWLSSEVIQNKWIKLAWKQVLMIQFYAQFNVAMLPDLRPEETQSMTSEG